MTAISHRTRTRLSWEPGTPKTETVARLRTLLGLS